MASVPRVLPRGRAALPREIVLMSQRSRLLEAVTAAAAEKGYAAMTLADITGAAGVSRATFYEHFSTKEQCFLGAYAEGADAHRTHVLRAIDSPPISLRDGLSAGVRAYLEVLEQQPVYARAFFIEVRAAGPRAAELRQSVIAGYVRLLRTWRDQLGATALPNELYQAAVGGVDEIVTARLHAGQPIEVEELHGLVLEYLERVLGGTETSLGT